MRKLIVLGIAVTMLMGLAVTAMATVDATWYVYLSPKNAVGGSTRGSWQGGVLPTAIDAWKGTTPDFDGNWPAGTGAAAEIMTSILDASSTLHPRTSADFRAPTTTANTALAPKVWDLYLRLNGGTAGSINLTGWITTAGKLDVLAGEDTVVELWLASEYGVVGESAIWTVQKNTTGSSSAVNFTMNGIAYDGVNDVMLKLVAYQPGVVPEPGSIIALLTGLVGLIGIRRRK